MRVDQLPKLSPINCEQLLNGKPRTKLANNTTLRQGRNRYVVTLHNTEVLTLEPETMTITINTGGYNTKTTIGRLNAMLAGYAVQRVNVKDGECVVTMLDGTTRAGNRITIESGDYR